MHTPTGYCFEFTKEEARKFIVACKKLNLNPAPNYNGKSDSDLVPGVEVRLQKAGSAITCSGHLQRWVPLSSSVTVLMGRNYKSE